MCPLVRGAINRWNPHFMHSWGVFGLLSFGVFHPLELCDGIRGFDISSILEWVENHFSVQLLETFVVSLWSVWFYWNSFVYGESDASSLHHAHASADSKYNWVVAYLADFTAANPLQSAASALPLKLWLASAAGPFKLNCDALLDGAAHRFKTGAVLHDVGGAFYGCSCGIFCCRYRSFCC